MCTTTGETSRQALVGWLIWLRLVCLANNNNAQEYIDSPAERCFICYTGMYMYTVHIMGPTTSEATEHRMSFGECKAAGSYVYIYMYASCGTTNAVTCK
jgi:hypothetical protein